MKLEVLFEDNHLLVINKPVGLLVHGDKTGDTTQLDLAKEYIKRKYSKPGKVFLGLTHRLDRPVSGCLIFARTSKALTRLNAQFSKKSISKEYMALTKNKTENIKGTWVDNLIKDHSLNKSFLTAVVQPNSKVSKLSYEMCGMNKGYVLFRLIPYTGRSHQIRVQMASRDLTIIGDKKYGYPRSLEDKSICLHCFRLRFEHPTTRKNISVQCYPPQTELWRPFISLMDTIDTYE